MRAEEDSTENGEDKVEIVGSKAKLTCINLFELSSHNHNHFVCT